MINVIVKNVNHYINACFVTLQSFFSLLTNSDAELQAYLCSNHYLMKNYITQFS